MDALTVLFVVLFCIAMIVVPPAIIFAFHHRLKQSRTNKSIKRRILVYCLLLFVFIGALVTTILLPRGEMAYIDRTCREPYDCNGIVGVAQRELWLRLALYPISQDICFTSNDYACKFIDREVTGYWANPPIEGEIALLGYYFFAVIFAIPSFVLYFFLRTVYLKPDKQKQKNDELIG